MNSAASLQYFWFLSCFPYQDTAQDEDGAKINLITNRTQKN